MCEDKKLAVSEKVDKLVYLFFAGEITKFSISPDDNVKDGYSCEVTAAAKIVENTENKEKKQQPGGVEQLSAVHPLSAEQCEALFQNITANSDTLDKDSEVDSDDDDDINDDDMPPLYVPPAPGVISVARSFSAEECDNLQKRMKELGEIMKMDGKGNKEIRYHLYCEAIFMIHGKLSFGNRFPLPPWLETEIKEAYPSDDDDYIGFRDEDMTP